MKACKTLLSFFLILAMLVSGLVSCTDPNDTTTGGDDPTPPNEPNGLSVTFMVDGTLYEQKTIALEGTPELPKTPEKQGYIFDGWYWDDGVWEKPFSLLSLQNLALGVEAKVYAKWLDGGTARLATPKGLQEGAGVLSWNAVIGATGYEVQIDSNDPIATDKAFIDLTARLTREGRYTICVRATTDAEGTADSAWSEVFIYVVDGNAAQAHPANAYGIGFGYDLANSEYYNVEAVKGVSPLDLNLLAPYIGKATFSIASSDYAMGETVEDYMRSYNTQIGMSMSAEGQYKCFTAGMKNSFNASLSAQKAGHAYQSFFTYFYNVVDDAYKIQNRTPADLRGMLSTNFINDLDRATPETARLTDDQLARYIIDVYGTHLVTGVLLGGRLECSYHITSTTQKGCLDAMMELETQASAGISGMFSANTSLDVKTEVSLSESVSNRQVVLKVKPFGGANIALGTLKELEENRSAWVDSLNDEKNRNAVGLLSDGLLPIFSLVPTDEKYDGVRAALESIFYATVDEAYQSTIAKYSLLSDTQFIDLSEYYSPVITEQDMTQKFNHTLYQDGIFHVKGKSGENNEIKKYVFHGLYEAENHQGDICRTMLKNFTIQVDSNHDIEIVLENVSFTAADGLPVIRLNPTEKQNITVTLTVNGESILIGGNGKDATEAGQNGGDGASAIDFSSSANAKLVIDGNGTLTAIGGNGGDGYNGADGENGTNATSTSTTAEPGKTGQAGGNGGNGGNAIYAAEVTAKNGFLLLYGGVGGDGANGGNGGNGGNGKAGTDGSPTNGGHGGNGGNGGSGGNGGISGNGITGTAYIENASVTVTIYSNGAGGNGGNGGVGGNGGSAGSKTPFLGIGHGSSGTAGNAGSGGNGGAGGTSGFTATDIAGFSNGNLTVKAIFNNSSMVGYGGDGNKGGKGGNTGQAHEWSNDANKVGAGGSGGNAGSGGNFLCLSAYLSNEIVNETSVTADIEERNGVVGEGGASGRLAVNNKETTDGTKVGQEGTITSSGVIVYLDTAVRGTIVNP